VKLDVRIELNLKVPEVLTQCKEAARLGIRDTLVPITNDIINIHPWKTRTGNNSRSITSEVSGMGVNQVVDPNGAEGAVYSTSGYGGILETGSSKMPAFPYFRPALDRHSQELIPNIKKYMP